MKIVHAIEGLERTSGVSLFCVEMCNRMAANGHEVVLVCSCRFEYPPSSAVKVLQANNLEVIDIRPDVVHMHGVWSMFNVRVLDWCRKMGVPYIVSPHGCFMTWAMRKGWLKKRLFFALMLKKRLLGARAIHVTTEQERSACEKHCLGGNYVLAPLGVDIREIAPPRRDGVKPRTVLFLSRVSPEKGVDMLISAWATIQTDGWRLVIAGPSWRGYAEQMMCKAKEAGLRNLEFIGAVVGEAKDKAYASADIFVLPSYSENFGSVVIEALAAGVPVICTKGAPWSELDRVGCGWWVDTNVRSLSNALQNAMSLPCKTLLQMGTKGREFVTSKYSWEATCDILIATYAS